MPTKRGLNSKASKLSSSTSHTYESAARDRKEQEMRILREKQIGELVWEAFASFAWMRIPQDRQI